MAAPQGVCVAFDDVALEPDPLWTTLDNVVSWSIDRGRSFEMDRTDGGTATIHLVDTVGDFDPKNIGGAYYGLMDPMKQVAIAMQNPVDLTWTTLFRGFVGDWDYELDETEKVLHVTIECVDAFDLLAAAEVVPGSFGTSATGSEGDVVYTDDQEVDARIGAGLDDARWSSSLRTIFSGNVRDRATAYAIREQVLSIIEEAADSEFPGVANLYVSKDGKVTFHGRFARFDPDGTASGTSWNFMRWYAGDQNAVDFDATVFAPISGPLQFNRSKSTLINVCSATPQGGLNGATIADTDIEGQIVTDPTSIDQYGIRNKSFESLITVRGKDDGLDYLQETKLFAQYYVANYAYPQTRLPQVVFRPKDIGDESATTLWALVTGVEISDIVNVWTTHPWGGGFNDDFYVEGIHYDVEGSATSFDDFTLTLDLSPVVYYAANPF